MIPNFTSISTHSIILSNSQTNNYPIKNSPKKARISKLFIHLIRIRKYNPCTNFTQRIKDLIMKNKLPEYQFSKAHAGEKSSKVSMTKGDENFIYK